MGFLFVVSWGFGGGFFVVVFLEGGYGGVFCFLFCFFLQLRSAWSSAFFLDVLQGCFLV